MVSRRDVLLRGSAFLALTGLVGACAPTSSAQTSDLSEADGVRTAEMIAKGEITASQALEAAIERTRAVNPQLNALAAMSFDEARSIARSGAKGAMGGVPTAIKDLLDWKGQPTLYGSRAFQGYVPEEHSDYMQAWLDAGTVPLGKSTSPEMGFISSTEPLVTGPTRNPWNSDYSPGGSSGGAASLVAARAVPIGHASDGGGSIRIPASCCGLFGLKPTIGRLKATSGNPGPVPISVQHALTRTVRDSEAMFRATEQTGRDAPYPELRKIGGPASKRLTIGLWVDPPAGSALNGEIRTAIEDTATLCEESGHTVVPFTIDMDGPQFIDDFLLYWAAGAAGFAERASAFTGKDISPEIVEPWTIGLAQLFQARQKTFGAAVTRLTQFGAVYDAAFADIDVMLTPVLGQLPPKIGEQDPTVEFDTLMQRVTEFAAYTALQNVAGAPGMSVPLHWSESGLPIGSHFSARKGEDDVLLALAYELEMARPWADKRALISA